MGLLDSIKKWAQHLTGNDPKQPNPVSVTQAPSLVNGPLRVTTNPGSQLGANPGLQAGIPFDPIGPPAALAAGPTMGKVTPTPKAPAPDAAAKPQSSGRLGSTSKSASHPDDYYYSKVSNPEARELIRKYAEKYNIDPSVAVAVAGHETGGTFDPLQKNLGGDGGTGLFQITPSVNSYGQQLVKDGKLNDPDAVTNAGAMQLRDDLLRAMAEGRFANDPDEMRKVKDAYQMFNGGPKYYNSQNLPQIKYNGGKFMDYYLKTLQ